VNTSLLIENLRRLGCQITEDSGEIRAIHYPANFSQSDLHALKLEVDSSIILEPISNNSSVDRHNESVARLDSVGTKALKNQNSAYKLEQKRVDISTPSFEKQPVADLVDSFLSIALGRGASDIHLLSDEKGFHVSMRIDGLLSELITLDANLAPSVIARVKVLSGMDITEKRKPQDGRMSLSLNQKDFDLRIASAPVVQGERLTMRIFSKSSEFATLKDLNVPKEFQDLLRNACANLYGLLLVCGPTGSGKTSTIYALLHELLNRGLNIVSIEDPVESIIEGISQSQVNRSIGYDFSEGVRSFLRHDPDVILVGEIRDAETAQAALRAALTGHLVISTVHATTVESVFSRLNSLGLQSDDIKVALNGVCNQRLVKCYCENCVENSMNELGHLSVLPEKFTGCSSCYYTGFSGRLPLLEFVATGTGDVAGKTIHEQAELLHKKGLIPKSEVMKVAQA